MAWVKREIGYWRFSTLQFPGYSCSICHQKYNEREYASVWKFNFCPQCGAKMIEVRDDSKE